MKLSMVSNPLASGVAASTVGTPTGRQSIPWGRMLAPIAEHGNMDAFYCVSVVEPSINENGAEVASAANARAARQAVQRFVASKRPRERWDFRAWRTELTIDGQPAIAETTDTDTYGLWARLVRVTEPDGSSRDCGDDDAVELAEAAHAETLRRMVETSAINAAITAEARRLGMTPSKLRADIAAEAKRRGVKVATIRAERGLQPVSL